MKHIFLTLLLASATGLPAATRQVSDAELLPKIGQALAEAMSIKDGKLLLESTRPLPKVKAVEGATVRVKILAIPPTGPQAFMRAQYEVLLDDQRAGVWIGFFRAQLIREVWIPQAVANRHMTLDEVPLARKKVNVISLRTGVWEGKPEDTLRLTQAIGAGMVLQPRHVQRKPVVFRNQVVQGTYQLRALNIRLELLALEDGAPGDFIRVRNKRSSKELRGLVIDSSTVRIQ